MQSGFNVSVLHIYLFFRLTDCESLTEVVMGIEEFRRRLVVQIGTVDAQRVQLGNVMPTNL